jgi:coenzyme F420-reducing hydrogenase delta subunit
LLDDFGIDRRRLRLVWVSASEGGRWAETANDMAEEIRSLGSIRGAS